MSKVVDWWLNQPADPAHRLPVVVALWRGHRRLKSCSRMSEAKKLCCFLHSLYFNIFAHMGEKTFTFSSRTTAFTLADGSHLKVPTKSISKLLHIFRAIWGTRSNERAFTSTNRRSPRPTGWMLKSEGGAVSQVKVKVALKVKLKVKVALKVKVNGKWLSK